MGNLTLRNISEAMRDIDICMMTTRTAMGALESRPMSNNREVDYDGESYFFANDDCSAVREIGTNPEVSLSYIHNGGLLGTNMYISVSGKAKLIRDRARMERHWVKDLEAWFKDGIDTPGLVMIQVKAEHIKYWKDYKEGEINLGVQRAA